MMRVSIVVPCFNCATVVGECLDSVLSQHHDDLEVVCVDDGSTDDTTAVLQRKAKADPRVVVVSQANRGVSAARNAGLRRSTGEVVLFVDADDALVDGALPSIVSRFAYGGVDCLVFGMKVEPEEATPMTLAHRLAPRDAVFDGNPKDLIFREHTH
ncbi:MAG: glycosyltransferase family 2 protein, partial [Atopobiaceae bacterium]|nr:glycosyltransferase family 2 protein [Atopobiaceae bacterium]